MQTPLRYGAMQSRCLFSRAMSPIIADAAAVADTCHAASADTLRHFRARCHATVFFHSAFIRPCYALMFSLLLLLRHADAIFAYTPLMLSACRYYIHCETLPFISFVVLLSISSLMLIMSSHLLFYYCIIILSYSRWIDLHTLPTVTTVELILLFIFHVAGFAASSLRRRHTAFTPRFSPATPLPLRDFATLITPDIFAMMPPFTRLSRRRRHYAFDAAEAAIIYFISPLIPMRAAAMRYDVCRLMVAMSIYAR